MPLMRAARLVAPARVEVEDAPLPVPGDGEVLVRMQAASICGSDVHVIFDGFADPEQLPARPGFPGHEGVGQVVESRAPGFEPGNLVLTVPPPADAGCFAEMQAVASWSLVGLPPGADLPRLLMAQQLGTTVYAFRRFWPAGGAGTAAVIGAGSAGLFFLQLLRLAGCPDVVVADLEPARLAVARSLGASLCVAAPEESVVEAVLDRTAGGADLVIEAAGYDVCRAQAVEAVRAGGRLGFFGFPERPDLAPFPVAVAFRKGVTIEFSVGAQREPGLRSFHEALDLISSGRVEVGYCLRERLPLERAPEALERARQRGHGAVKLTIEMGTSTAE